MMEVDKKKTRTDEAWVRLYARFETDCLMLTKLHGFIPHRTVEIAFHGLEYL